MLIPGIKIGQHDWQDKIAAKPKFAEIWYRVDQAKIYTPILTALQSQNIPFGLHFWGVTSSKHEANLAYPRLIRNESIQLIKTCLDAARDWQALYVNIHSGNLRPMHLNLDDWDMTADPNLSVIPDDEAAKLRSSALEDLGRYAQMRGTALLVELIPNATYNRSNRLIPIPEFPVSTAGLSDLCERRLVGFTNDFCHTFAIEHDLPRQELFQHFLDKTKQFLPYTHLCHINSLSLPYNGTDEHRGILPHDMSQPGVFPTRSELIELLRLYRQLPHDVYLVGEPMEDHVGNYKELSRLIAEL